MSILRTISLLPAFKVKICIKNLELLWVLSLSKWQQNYFAVDIMWAVQTTVCHSWPNITFSEIYSSQNTTHFKSVSKIHKECKSEIRQIYASECWLVYHSDIRRWQLVQECCRHGPWCITLIPIPSGAWSADRCDVTLAARTLAAQMLQNANGCEHERVPGSNALMGKNRGQTQITCLCSS